MPCINALRWLKANNKYYGSIDIDDIALQQLPEDGDLTQCFSTIIDDDPNKTMSIHKPMPVDTYTSHLSRTYVPSSPQKQSIKKN